MRKLFLASYVVEVDDQEVNDYALVAIDCSDEMTQDDELQKATDVFKMIWKSQGGTLLRASARPTYIFDESHRATPAKTLAEAQSQRYNPLSAPSAHTLQECFAELKFGRPRADQEYLDEQIKYLNEE